MPHRGPARLRSTRLAVALGSLLALLWSLGAARSASAEDPDLAEEVRRLREDLEVERRGRAELERRLAAVERAGTAPSQEEIGAMVQSYVAERDLFATAPVALTRPGAGEILSVSAALSVVFGTSTATDAALPHVNLGDHDPRVRGANVRNEELVLAADVDPYFEAVLDVVYKIDEEGESTFELEEAYAVTTSLPAGLQLKVGQFFTEFGRNNPTHPHSWEFFEQPVILGRVFGGDGWRGQGMRLSWHVPTCGRCPITLLAGWQNARGETQASFLGEEGEEVGDHVLGERDVANLGDLAYHVRAEMGCDVAGPCHGTVSWLAGLSGGFGPNATGPTAYTCVYGADVYLRWRPRTTDGGWPWVAWQTEVVLRDYAADAQTQFEDDGMGGLVQVDVSSSDYRDWGFYSQVVWGFARPWSVGLRVDGAYSDGAYAGDAWRVSAALTYYPSEFSRIRLQVQYDDVEGLSDEVPGDDDGNVSVWLGFDFALGKHAAHKF